MKRLLVFTLLTVVSVSTIGCSCGGLFNRGPSCPTCGQPGVVGYGPDAYGAAPAMPETYAVPGPG